MLQKAKKIIITSLENGTEAVQIDNFSWPKNFEALTKEDNDLAIKFALDISEDTKKPRHKHEHGKRNRELKEYLMDMYIGKLGEIFVAKKLSDLKIECSKVDFDIYDGFDDSDLKIKINNKEYNLSVKTSKANSRLLLLEWNKYNDKGHYLHGMNGTIKVDAFVAPVIKLNSYYIPKDLENDSIEDFLKSLNPQGYVFGYLSPKIIINCKKNNKFLKAGTKLNDSVSLEVDNFAIRLDSLSPLENLKSPKC